MKLFGFIAQALSDGESPSTMRLLMLYGVGLIIFVWTVVSLHSAALMDFPQSVVEVIGVLIVGKVAEKHIENRTP